MTITDWDAIIVGAGPAGAALACRLSPQRRVLLLERSMPRAPTTPRIGESLPGAARVLLQRCGAFDHFLAAGHRERGATVSQWEGDAPNWFDHLRDPHGPGWHLDRARFDADLREAAVAAGASLRIEGGALRASRVGDHWQIEVDASAQTHRAPVLVDATGRNAAIARQLGIARHVDDELICLHAYLLPDPNDEDQCTRIAADINGWWYSVRVPDGQRVLAFHLDADDGELHALRQLPDLLAKARRQTVLADVLPAAADGSVHARPAGSAALDRDAMRRCAPGFFAIGDALLSFDPIASQGIFHALASAESAARALEPDAVDPSAARDAFLAEMDAVHAHYRQRFVDTYAAPRREGQYAFWRRRYRGEGAVTDALPAATDPPVPRT
ncbi:MAG: hypothetical protein AMXMBFR59_32320 [Rhodanobacteraceae bacterium]